MNSNTNDVVPHVAVKHEPITMWRSRDVHQNVWLAVTDPAVIADLRTKPDVEVREFFNAPVPAPMYVEQYEQYVKTLVKDVAGWKAEAEAHQRRSEYFSQKLDLINQHARQDVWYWAGDGDDHLESMSNGMAVVIRADQLRGLLAASVEAPVAEAPVQPVPAQPSIDRIPLDDGSSYLLRKSNSTGPSYWDFYRQGDVPLRELDVFECEFVNSAIAAATSTLFQTAVAERETALVKSLTEMLSQFTKTPSTLKDSEVRGRAHAVLASYHNGSKAVQHSVEEQTGPGTPSARLEWLLGELAKLFPSAVDLYGAAPPELAYFEHIVRLKSAVAVGE